MGTIYYEVEENLILWEPRIINSYLDTSICNFTLKKLKRNAPKHCFVNISSNRKWNENVFVTEPSQMKKGQK